MAATEGMHPLDVGLTGEEYVNHVINDAIHRGWTVSSEGEIRNKEGELVQVLDIPEDAVIQLDAESLASMNKALGGC